MRQHSSFKTLFLTIFLVVFSNNVMATNNRSYSLNNDEKTKMTIADVRGVDNVPRHSGPVTREEDPIKKTHSMKTEELAHIHHFHKERVKKLKRHHKKFWILSKMLLILCHLLLLVGAYMHLFH